MAASTDEALVERIAGGDRAAMHAFYARHSTRVYRFLVRLVRNPTIAEDVMSDVFTDIWQQASRFEGRSSASTWAFSIARFKALSELRRRPQAALDPEVMEAVEDGADTPEVTVQKAGKAQVIRRCMDRLSAEHREVIDLVYYHEFSVDQVAEILGAPAGTVKTRMFHARKRLAEMLTASGIDRGWP